MECLGVPGLRPDWSNQTKKSRVLVNFSGVLPRGSQEEGPGRCGRRVLGESYQELTFICDSTGCYLGHVLGGRG